MRATIGFLTIAMLTGLLAMPALAGEDYALLTAHADSAMVRKRSPEGRVLEFVDVLGRKNRCGYDGEGKLREIRFASEAGDFRIRLVRNKRGDLTSMVLADGTIVLFRNGAMMPSREKPSLAEKYAAALEHWLARNNAGI